MSFTEAIRDGFSKYATFGGRSSRAAYWWFALFEVLVLFAAAILDAALKTGQILYVVAAVAIFLPSLAVTVRRLHDAGHSGWWVLIGIIPFVGAIVLIVFCLQGSQPPNEWGRGPDESAAEAPLTA